MKSLIGTKTVLNPYKSPRAASTQGGELKSAEDTQVRVLEVDFKLTSGGIWEWIAFQHDGRKALVLHR